MTRYLYDRFSPGLDPTPRLIPLRRIAGPRLIRLGGFDGFGVNAPADDAPAEGDTFESAPVFAWPIQPPPKTTPGQAFTAKLPSGKPHNAQDMGKGGDQVKSAADGTVTVSTASGDARGNIIHIDHAGGWSTRYYHLDQRLVAKGGQVQQGQQIGIVGRTGLPKNNPHLHFMVYWGKTPIDPLVVLPAREGETVAVPGGPGWLDEAFAFAASSDPGTDVAEAGGVGLVIAAAGLAWLFFV